MTSDARRDPLADLSAQGVAVWLDDLSRKLLATGALQSLITSRHVVGVTTNPTIFASALSKGDRYDGQLRDLAEQGADVDTAVFAITTDDVRAACDVLAPVYQQTAGRDGRVSIEVDPRLARDTRATAGKARALRSAVDRGNLFVKIPATQEGLAAITQVTSEGISVNVTLIFALERYRAVMDAYLSGLEQAAATDRNLSAIRSVASFCVSRVDTEVDARLDQIATSAATRLKGKAAIANARLAYQAYQELITSPRWQELARLGSQPQRPLWASTGVKNPAYPDTMYVTGLVAPAPSTPCRDPRSRRSPTTARSRATPSPGTTTRRDASLTSSRPPVSTSMTSPPSWNATASPNSRTAGTSSPPPSPPNCITPAPRGPDRAFRVGQLHRASLGQFPASSGAVSRPLDQPAM
jgi:transaldolase